MARQQQFPCLVLPCLVLLTLGLLPAGAEPLSGPAAPPIELGVGRPAAVSAITTSDAAALAAAFRRAYVRYPRLPAGSLEALAFTASRWQHRLPGPATERHHGMPAGIGVFGLHDGSSAVYADTLSQVATVAGTRPAAMLADLPTYVEAVAAWLDRQLTGDTPRVETLTPAFATLSGIVAGTPANDYARQSHAYSALLVLARGVDSETIRIAARPIDWSRAFNPATLQLLRAPQVQLRLDTPTQPPALAAMETPVDYPEALWSPTNNFSSRAGSRISHIVVHTTQGAYSGSIAWLANPVSQVSAHYVIRSADGQITQMVREADKAWHAASANAYTIGIEHEGFVDNPSWYTAAMYQASARLGRSICVRHAIDCQRAYVGMGWHKVVTLPGNLTIKGHQHYPDQTHTDPGTHWDWPRYYSLLTDGAALPLNQAPLARLSVSCSERSCTADAKQSSDEDGWLSQYAWQWGDGSDTRSEAATQSHHFAADGSYKIVLTITDDRGQTASAEQLVTLKGAPPAPPPAGKGGGGAVSPLMLLLLAGTCVALRRVRKPQ
ncbi:N-acetylmuramoyl-L-alanine amidase [Chitinimonas sp. BJYL2]|uniref:N-acetylmuramoyl-L-alanine amidase n=1 Tax=Chitinimonas sp. BJYL2 TaxID=2976696 RepID=UPI0022B3F3DA|nr:N-acetylmuramoyl-L-alanine amidase [Chitinimonas sp. BJYL2]